MEVARNVLFIIEDELMIGSLQINSQHNDNQRCAYYDYRTQAAGIF